MKHNENQFLFVEKYRPRTIEDTILPAATKAMVRGYIEQGRIPNLLFHGSAGTGKTTLARAMCEEVGADYIIINASSENSVDVLRTKVTQFASTTSFSESRKVIILDEADALTSAFQSGFRNAMEAFSENCTFILTCNFPQRIIEPIHSRCGVVGFKIANKDKPAIAMQFSKRVLQILDHENIEYDKKVVIELIQKYFPDFRRCLNELQKFASTGKIDSGILVSLDKNNFDVLVDSLKSKKFNDVRRWTSTNSDIDSVQFFKTFYDMIFDKVEPKSIPEIVILIGQYQYYASQVADQEINMTAFLTEILVGGVTWK
jgi:DNA polymerase III delta prime subunit